MYKKKKPKLSSLKLSKKAKKKQTLSRKLVLEFAIRIADEFGLEKLSMRHLASSLGVEAMSLYNHVKNKDEVLDGMVDLVISKITLPRIGGDWKLEMITRAKSAREILILHPWATSLIVSRMNVGEGMMTYFDTTLGCLHAAGFSLQTADHIINTIDSHIYGFILQELNFPIDPNDFAKQAESFMPQLELSPFSHITNLGKEVVSGKYNGIHDFAFGLNLILDGLEKLRPESNGS
ncbi:TetR/AcrR family transcriptional regulator [Leptospira bandrabouensis]|uniref:TetR/AcrR family transcriptional regulator n=1 Tax=Leptospira bandrabouensis TaxID=2484903 RepID=UPI00223CEABC|nr:TetR/AcrR family transcriptional regulator [Leptospira bandrabouensis]MCW7459514.1 TetR/AcrR family transcriptional regulator [Leptospira bandrabouensis]MCW7478468.1 TetR/AcrR family transcriptional regulator [Leptospira bandrabouensis]MCW7486248.1 TetR/AcrR family transcriptional regulator [Leptospira bandrabouensis]